MRATIFHFSDPWRQTPDHRPLPLISQRSPLQQRASHLSIRLRRRIGDLSEFVKTYTEMFSQRIRREKKYVGVLWQNRFKSVLIQDGSQFQTVLRYINNNPVRAKYTKTSQEYAWCTLGAHNLREQPLRAFAKQCKDNVESLKSAGDSPQIDCSDFCNKPP